MAPHLKWPENREQLQPGTLSLTLPLEVMEHLLTQVLQAPEGALGISMETDTHLWEMGKQERLFQIRAVPLLHVAKK